MNVRKEIENYSAEEDKKILFWLLERYPMQSQWKFVAGLEWVKYGTSSFQKNRKWFPSEEGRILYLHKNQTSFKKQTKKDN